jgi:hypothetical protein
MSGGGKGGRETTEVKIPEWLEAAAKENLARGQAVANIGYTPYYGPDVAAMTPMQMASMQGTSSAAGAFGLPGGGMTGMEGMPTPQTFAGGVQGYSSGGLYDEALRELETRRPGQYNAITGMFVDPITGAAPLSFGPSVQPMAPMAAAPLTYPTQGGGRDRDGMGGMSSGAGAGAASGGMGGYTGLRDMFDGGGPGRSGSTFSGGGRVSGIANAAGISPRGSRDNKGRKK